MVYAKFGGQTECIMGNWKIENSSPDMGQCSTYPWEKQPDFESGRNQRESEWQLDKVSLCNALEILGFEPDVDLFASRD